MHTIFPGLLEQVWICVAYRVVHVCFQFVDVLLRKFEGSLVDSGFLGTGTVRRAVLFLRPEDYREGRELAFGKLVKIRLLHLLHPIYLFIATGEIRPA